MSIIGEQRGTLWVSRDRMHVAHRNVRLLQGAKRSRWASKVGNRPCNQYVHQEMTVLRGLPTGKNMTTLGVLSRTFVRSSRRSLETVVCSFMTSKRAGMQSERAAI